MPRSGAGVPQVGPGAPKLVSLHGRNAKAGLTDPTFLLLPFSSMATEFFSPPNLATIAGSDAYPRHVRRLSAQRTFCPYCFCYDILVPLLMFPLRLVNHDYHNVEKGTGFLDLGELPILRYPSGVPSN